MGEIVASNVHPYFSDWDVSHNATVLRKTVITSMDVDKITEDIVLKVFFSQLLLFIFIDENYDAVLIKFICKEYLRLKVDTYFM